MSLRDCLAADPREAVIRLHAHLEDPKAGTLRYRAGSQMGSSEGLLRLWWGEGQELVAAMGRQSLTYHLWSRILRSPWGVGEARHLLPFPEEGPTNVAGTRGILADRSHSFPRPTNHNI